MDVCVAEWYPNPHVVYGSTVCTYFMKLLFNSFKKREKIRIYSLTGFSGLVVLSDIICFPSEVLPKISLVELAWQQILSVSVYLGKSLFHIHFLKIPLLGIRVFVDSILFEHFECFPTAFWLSLFLLRSQPFIWLGFIVSDTFSPASSKIFSLSLIFSLFTLICLSVGLFIGVPGCVGFCFCHFSNIIIFLSQFSQFKGYNDYKFGHLLLISGPQAALLFRFQCLLSSFLCWPFRVLTATSCFCELISSALTWYFSVSIQII